MQPFRFTFVSRIKLNFLRENFCEDSILHKLVFGFSAQLHEDVQSFSVLMKAVISYKSQLFTFWSEITAWAAAQKWGRSTVNLKDLTS